MATMKSCKKQSSVRRGTFLVSYKKNYFLYIIIARSKDGTTYNQESSSRCVERYVPRLEIVHQAGAGRPGSVGHQRDYPGGNNKDPGAHQTSGPQFV